MLRAQTAPAPQERNESGELPRVDLQPAGELTIAVAPREVERLCGYGPQGPPPGGRVARRLVELQERARSLCTPRGAWALVTHKELPELGLSGGMGEQGEGPTAALAVCTIGPALEQEVARLSAAGELLDALLLDAYGSAAAEAAAEALDQEICAAMTRLAFTPAPRRSPGYGSWTLDHQPALLSRLPATELGLTLTAGGMMIPRKSVSFAILLTPAGPAPRPEPAHAAVHRCADCPLRTRCSYRRAEAPVCLNTKEESSWKT